MSVRHRVTTLSRAETAERRRLNDVLSEARAIQMDAARVGFDWPDVRGALDKVREEIGELDAAVTRGQPGEVREELGDLLFSVVNVSRFVSVDAAEALHAANAKFSSRFARVCDEIERRGRKVEDCTLEELDSVWNALKS